MRERTLGRRSRLRLRRCKKHSEPQGLRCCKYKSHSDLCFLHFLQGSPCPARRPCSLKVSSAIKSHVTLRVSSTLTALGCGGYGSISLPRLAAALRDGVTTKYHPTGENHHYHISLHGQCTHCPYSIKTKNRDSFESRFFVKLFI